MVAAGIAILNISVKSLLRCKINFFQLINCTGIARCESAHTKTSEIFSSMTKMFVV